MVEIIRSISTIEGGHPTANKIALSLGIISLFILSAVAPITFGINVKTTIVIESTTSDDGPMDSAWSMYCHDTKHTSQSQYSTANNPIKDRWWFNTNNTRVDACYINIVKDETIYLTCNNGIIYAISNNGFLKWTFTDFDENEEIRSHPAVDENGVIYLGTFTGNFYAIYPNGTLKWKYTSPQDERIYTSPVIGDDGTVYFSTFGVTSIYFGNIYAFNNDGTVKWKYELDSCSYSSPAISDDGIIYCGDHSGHLHAVHPNGTLYWKVPLQGWMSNSPSVADDGTIYALTYDSYLYALDSYNGNIKWKYTIPISDDIFLENPSLGPEGTIYFFGIDWSYNIAKQYFHAVNPDGTEKWTKHLENSIMLQSYIEPVISADGTIYVAGGNCLTTFHPNGAEKICKIFETPFFRVLTYPAIGKDGTIYLGMLHYTEKEGPPYFIDTLFLHTYKSKDADSPNTPEIKGPANGNPDKNYNYTIVATDPNGDDIYYYVCWGEPTHQIPMGPWIPSKFQEFGPYSSGEEITLNHSWHWDDEFIIKVVAKDTNNLVGEWAEFCVNIKPRTRAWLRFFDMFPILQRIISYIL